MNTLKLKVKDGKHYAFLGIVLNDGNEIFLKYRGRLLNDLQTTLGCIEDPHSKAEGVPEWFNHEGLTYTME